MLRNESGTYTVSFFYLDELPSLAIALRSRYYNSREERGIGEMNECVSLYINSYFSYSEMCVFVL